MLRQDLCSVILRCLRRPRIIKCPPPSVRTHHSARIRLTLGILPILYDHAPSVPPPCRVSQHRETPRIRELRDVDDRGVHVRARRTIGTWNLQRIASRRALVGSDRQLSNNGNNERRSFTSAACCLASVEVWTVSATPHARKSQDVHSGCAASYRLAIAAISSDCAGHTLYTRPMSCSLAAQ